MLVKRNRFGFFLFLTSQETHNVKVSRSSFFYQKGQVVSFCQACSFFQLLRGPESSYKKYLLFFWFWHLYKKTIYFFVSFVFTRVSERIFKISPNTNITMHESENTVINYVFLLHGAVQLNFQTILKLLSGRSVHVFPATTISSQSFVTSPFPDNTTGTVSATYVHIPRHSRQRMILPLLFSNRGHKLVICRYCNINNHCRSTLSNITRHYYY